MKLLFDKSGGGARELRELTSSYYANNDFKLIRTEVLLQTEALIDLIGPAVYLLAEKFYWGETIEPNESSADESGIPEESEQDYSELVQHIQLAIGYAACLQYYKATIISHEDNGRKVKINGTNEKMPWEWMFDRDDEAHQHNANRAVDRLIKFLDNSGLAAWNGSEAQLATRELFISNAKDFNRIYPIDNSGLFYHKVKAWIAEVQRTKIRPALGAELYDELLVYHKAIDKANFESNTDNDVSALLAFVQTAIPMLTMSIAIERLSINFMPNGIVQEFKSMIQSRNASQVALDETIRRFKVKFDRQSARALNELKQFLNAQVNYEDYPLIPDNNENQKYFLT